jgi:hypothetical protein
LPVILGIDEIVPQVETGQAVRSKGRQQFVGEIRHDRILKVFS